MFETLLLVAVVVGWLILNSVILPRLGVRT